MPKKKRKGRSSRRRPNTGRSHLTLAPPPPEPVVPEPVDLPHGATEPLLRLEFSPEATLEDVERAIRYWNPLPEGGWAELVSAVGVPSKVAAELVDVCEAYLPEHLCGTCASPIRVTSRSDAAALAGQDLRRRQGQAYVCVTCRGARKRRQAEEARAAQAREQLAQQAREENVSAYLAARDKVCRHHRRTRELRVEDACVLMAMIQRSKVTAVLPPASDFPVRWMWEDEPADCAVLSRLFHGQWITLDRSVSTEHFVFDDDGEIETFYPGMVPLRLITSVSDTREDMVAILSAHSQETHRERLKHQIRRMEADSLRRYLHGLLVDRYQYPPVPENKVSDLYGLLLDGLEDYTFGQMVCFLWRTVDTAAAWKERKQLTDAHASSATVTILEGKLSTARECKMAIPEYELPRSHNDPPALSAGRTLLVMLEDRDHLGCDLHGDALPCSSCLGMLYAGGEDAEEIHRHYHDLEGVVITLRPDLATKIQFHPSPSGG